MKHYNKLIRPYLIWSILIILVPFLLIILYSLTTGGNELVNIQFTLDNFKKIGEPIYLDVMKKSFHWDFFLCSFVWCWDIFLLILLPNLTTQPRIF